MSLALKESLETSLKRRGTLSDAEVKAEHDALIEKNIAAREKQADLDRLNHQAGVAAKVRE